MRVVLYSLPGKLPSKLDILGLEVECIIGDLPYERTQVQKVVFDIGIIIDIAKVAQSDELNDTINYVEIAEAVEKIAIEGQFNMIETLAARVAGELKNKYPTIEEIVVSLRKDGTIPRAQGAKITVKL